MDNSEGIRAVISEPLLDLISGTLKEFAQTEEFMDVSLTSSNGIHLKAHRVILAAASGYFRNALKMVPQQSAVVICLGREFEQLGSILKLIYEGEVELNSVQEFEALKRACEDLGIQNVDKIVGMDRKNDSSTGMSKRKRGPRNHVVRAECEKRSELEQLLRSSGQSKIQNEDLDRPLNFSLQPPTDAKPPPAYENIAEKHNGGDGLTEPLIRIRSEESLRGQASQLDQSEEEHSGSQRVINPRNVFKTEPDIKEGSPSMLESRNFRSLAEDFNNPSPFPSDNVQVDSICMKTDELSMTSGPVKESIPNIGRTSGSSKPAIATPLTPSHIPDVVASQPTQALKKDSSNKKPSVGTAKPQQQRKQRARTGIKRKLPAYPNSYQLTPEFQAMIQSMAQQMTMQPGRLDSSNFHRSSALAPFAIPPPMSNFKLMSPMAGLQGCDNTLTSKSNSSRKSATTTSKNNFSAKYQDLVRKAPVCKKGPTANVPAEPSMSYGSISPPTLPPQPKRVRTKLDAMRGLPGSYIASPVDGLQQQYLPTDFQAGSPASTQTSDSVSSSSQPRQTQKKSKPLKCNKCDKSFVYPKSYIDHMSTHDSQ